MGYKTRGKRKEGIKVTWEIYDEERSSGWSWLKKKREERERRRKIYVMEEEEERMEGGHMRRERRERRNRGMEATIGGTRRGGYSMWRKEKVLKQEWRGKRYGNKGEALPRGREVTRRNQSREIKEMEHVLCDFYSVFPSS